MFSVEIDGKTLNHDSSECPFVMIEAMGSLRRVPCGSIQNKKGVYIFYNHEGVPIRIGKASILRNRILSYFTNSYGAAQVVAEGLYEEMCQVSVIYTDDNSALESDLLIKYKPKWNTQGIKNKI